MNEIIKKLDKEYKELLNAPNKSKDDFAKQNEIRISLAKELEKEELTLVQDLKMIGLNITSVWDLVNTKDRYPKAIPILIEHLKKEYHERNKEGIVRALSVKEAVGKAASALINEYNQTSKDKESLRWAIGNAIYTVVTENDVESILSVVKDIKNGASRQMFVAALGKTKSPKAEEYLIHSLEDEEVIPQALEALGRMKSKKAKEKIMALANHPKTVIKKEANKALRKLL